MSVATIFELLFAAGVAATVAALAVALSPRAPRDLFLVLGAFLAAAATSAWVAFALELDRALAVAAAGLSLCAVVQLAGLRLRELIARQRQLAQELDQVE
ncbi:MAG: hypothetical protein M3292_08795, partial [Actinomycetota bacterium]|nr:hypothetical protein [Actinomycetota bacterium]